jgi:hypothetical protein
VLAERPEVARLRARLLRCRIERFVEVERLRPFPPLAGLERSQQVLDLVLAEPREREVEIGCALEIGEEAWREARRPMNPRSC